LSRQNNESRPAKTTNDIINIITQTKKDRFLKLETCLLLIYSMISQRRSFFKMNFEEFDRFGIMSQQAKVAECAPMHCLQICKTCTGLPCLPICIKLAEKNEEYAELKKFVTSFVTTFTVTVK